MLKQVFSQVWQQRLLAHVEQAKVSPYPGESGWQANSVCWIWGQRHRWLVDHRIFQRTQRQVSWKVIKMIWIHDILYFLPKWAVLKKSGSDRSFVLGYLSTVINSKQFKTNHLTHYLEDCHLGWKTNWRKCNWTIDCFVSQLVNSLRGFQIHLYHFLQQVGNNRHCSAAKRSQLCCRNRKHSNQ